MTLRSRLFAASLALALPNTALIHALAAQDAAPVSQSAPKAEAEARAGELLEGFGLADKAKEFPDRLSGGQQQRVAIVRSLMSEPELLLLDEVTSALDPELVAEVLRVIRGLADSGMTMVLATHEMGFARKVANRVVFMDEGEVVEVADPETFFNTPRTERAKLFLSQLLAH